MEYNMRTRRSSPEFSSSQASTVSRGYGSGLSSGYGTGTLHSPVGKKYPGHVEKETNGFTETRRASRSEGISASYGLDKEEKNYMSSSSAYRSGGSPTFHNLKSPISPSFSSPRRYRSTDRDFDQHDHLDRNRSSASPTSTVWLSKKMKDAAHNGFAESDHKVCDKQQPYSPLLNSRYERSKSDLEPISRRRLHSLDSPSDSIDYLIPRKETSHYMSVDRDVLSPRDSVISRNSGILSSEFKSRASPSKDYKSLNKYSGSNLKSPDLYPQTSTRDQIHSDTSKLYKDIYQPRDRSNSFHDLRDQSTVLKDLPKSRVRHKTLAYGVSGQDLERARFGSTRQGSDEDMKKILRELEDTGFFSQSRFSSSAHINSCSPLISNTAKLHSFSSNTSSIPSLPPSSSQTYHSNQKSFQQKMNVPNMSPQTFINLMNGPSSMPDSFTKLSTPTPFSVPRHIQPGPPTTLPLTRTTSNSSLPPYSFPIPPNPVPVSRGQDISSIQDDALIVLKKHDLDALLAGQRQKEYISQPPPPPIASSQTNRESWVKKKSGYNGDVDYKKLALVNDDLLKMWEESQAENTRLRLELSGVKGDLETARYQLESAAKQVSKNTAVTDQEKREKQIVVKKLAEMEEELKLLALSENLTDQTLDQLKNDNARLRDENGALLRVIAKMSK